jgi:DNA gyrase subunit A
MAKKNTNKEIVAGADNSVIYDKNLEEVMHSSMIPYSEYVIMDRALPRVEDGLKPVQRRILFTLHELGITPDKPYKKSARIVGDCLGKYHPHGDTSVYDAMVRMAQDFNMRMPLVDGHGNFGSPDGDGAAAMRYTEARMGTLAQHLLRDLEKDTVPWSWNFDDTIKEPDMLPGRFPNLLVNGTSGIAIGLSTSIPTHNLGEVIDGVVALMENPKITLEGMMKFIPGPDFPTGGYIVGGEQLKQAYETGRGKISMKAKIHIEEENDKKSIVITELPYQTNRTNILKKIVELREAKKEIYGGIQDVVDESDRNGIRAVVKVKREVDAEKLVQMLYKNTDLQKTFPINMVAIANGKPMQLSLMEILRYYLEYQVTIIVRRTKYDLAEALRRAEIVRGLLIAIDNIDEVIRIIRRSKSHGEAKTELRARFAFTELQAGAILEMRLKTLTGLEKEKLQLELKDLEERIELYNKILASRKEQYAVIRGELLEIKKAHKSERKSQIKDTDGDVIIKEIRPGEIEYRENVLLVGANGLIKFVSPKNFSMSQTAIEQCDEESLLAHALRVNNRENVYAFTNLGNCYKLDVNDYPEKKWRDKGMRLAEMFKEAVPDETIVSVFSDSQELSGQVFIATKNGMIKKSSWSEMMLQKNAYKVMNLSDDTVIAVEKIVKDSVIMVTKSGQYIMFGADEVPEQGRVAGGVRGISLSDDEVVFAGQADEEGDIVIIASTGYGKRVITATLESGTRYRKGNKIIDLPEGDVVFACVTTEPCRFACQTADGGITALDSDKIDMCARNTRGRALIRDTVVLSVTAHKAKA